MPSKLPALSVVENASLTLAIDTAGTLFRSDDAGVTWLPAQPIGNAVRSPSVSPSLDPQLSKPPQ